MAHTANKHHKYTNIADCEDETRSFITESEKETLQYEFEDTGYKSKLRSFLPLFVHLIFLLAYTAMYIYWRRPTEIKERFFSPSDAPIEYETVQFHKNIDGDVTPYQGPSTPETDAIWNDLIDVGPGLIWIDDETAKQLPTNTSNRINGEGYVGVVEMFHQLHCLNRIRILFYNHTRNPEQDPPEISKSHTEHCFDYLRQTLMCHGDLNLMSINWEAEPGIYTAKFDVIKQCRNFDIIKDWVKEHQTGWWPLRGHPSG